MVARAFEPAGDGLYGAVAVFLKQVDWVKNRLAEQNIRYPQLIVPVLATDAPVTHPLTTAPAVTATAPTAAMLPSSVIPEKDTDIRLDKRGKIALKTNLQRSQQRL